MKKDLLNLINEWHKWVKESVALDAEKNINFESFYWWLKNIKNK